MRIGDGCAQVVARASTALLAQSADSSACIASSDNRVSTRSAYTHSCPTSLLNGHFTPRMHPVVRRTHCDPYTKARWNLTDMGSPRLHRQPRDHDPRHPAYNTSPPIQHVNASAHRIHWCLRSPLMNSDEKREKRSWMMFRRQRRHLIYFRSTPKQDGPRAIYQRSAAVGLYYAP